MIKYDYDINRVIGRHNVADALSRLNEFDDTKLPKIQFTELCIPVDILKQDTIKDRYLTEPVILRNGNYHSKEKLYS